MSEEIQTCIKNIDNLQGKLLQKLIDTFNDIVQHDQSYDDIGNITNIQQLKTTILGRLKKSVALANSNSFFESCLACRAVRILGLLKYVIATEHLEIKDAKKLLGESITDYKVDKRYTETFQQFVNDLKGNVAKFISSKTLRKQMIIDNKVIKFLATEKQALETAFPGDKTINPPEWISTLNAMELLEFANQTIIYLKESNYKEFSTFTEGK